MTPTSAACFFSVEAARRKTEQEASSVLAFHLRYNYFYGPYPIFRHGGFH